MFEKWYLLLALAAAILYAISASSLKAAADRGSRTLSTTLIANIATAIGFLAFVPWGDGIFPSSWWPSLTIGGLFFGGQWSVIIALERGDASLATPAMGSKAVLVALILATCFGRELHLRIWIAVLLTSVGLAIFAFSPRLSKHGSVALTLIFSACAAACFAMFDVMTQIYSPTIGFGRLMPWAMVFAALITVAPVLLL
jgi:drug/metabolite transporter (DMT)-like permease